ncbi:MAG TPA: hypothetical protein VGO11_11570 [Chthoniobacteraceae bacterium]|jgi:hypothetical protein|nr:hypothetical protein [Chthoniobacteraceae bacterium]
MNIAGEDALTDRIDVAVKLVLDDRLGSRSFVNGSARFPLLPDPLYGEKGRRAGSAGSVIPDLPDRKPNGTFGVVCGEGKFFCSVLVERLFGVELERGFAGWLALTCNRSQAETDGDD